MLARAVDPLSMMTLIPVVGHLMYAGRLEEAMAEAERALELFPNHPTFQRWIADMLWYEGAYDEALMTYEKAWGPESKTLAAGTMRFRK